MMNNHDHQEFETQDFEIDHSFDEESDSVWRFFCIVFTRDQKPLLKYPALAEKAVQLLRDTVASCHAQLWGYVVLPDSVQFVIEVEKENDYHTCVETFKTSSEKVLVETIKAKHKHLIDRITYYNPAWTEPSYLVWKAGYQTQLLSSMYALSNKIADLVTKPVDLGLVDNPEDWLFSSYRADSEDQSI